MKELHFCLYSCFYSHHEQQSIWKTSPFIQENIGKRYSSDSLSGVRVFIVILGRTDKVLHFTCWKEASVTCQRIKWKNDIRRSWNSEQLRWEESLFFLLWFHFKFWRGLFSESGSSVLLPVCTDLNIMCNL